MFHAHPPIYALRISLTGPAKAPATGTDPMIGLRLPKPQTARLDRWAKVNGYTRSEAIRVLIDRGIRVLINRDCSAIANNDVCVLPPPSPPAEKATARQDQAGQASADDRARCMRRGIGHESKLGPPPIRCTCMGYNGQAPLPWSWIKAVERHDACA